MEDKKKILAICLSALVVGSAGMWIGIASIIQFTIAVGPQGPQGEQGDQGIGAVGLVVVGFLDPDEGDIITGSINIKALIGGTYNYSLQLLRNGSLISDSVPFEWDSTTVADGWWNLTLKVQDLDTMNSASDTIFIYTLNHGPMEWYFIDQTTDSNTLDGSLNFTVDIPVQTAYFMEYNYYITDPSGDHNTVINMTVYCVFEVYNGIDYVFHQQTLTRFVYLQGAWTGDAHHPISVSWLPNIDSGYYRVWVYVESSTMNFDIMRGSSVYISILY